MGHVRLLSWLLLGGLFQSLSTHAPCTPIPPEASCHVADHIQVILAGFAEQSKASVLHMSSLFHAFILCQVRISKYLIENSARWRHHLNST